jgi:hypothetical protein
MHFDLDNSIEQRPSWEADGRSISREIPPVLWTRRNVGYIDTVASKPDAKQ